MFGQDDLNFYSDFVFIASIIIFDLTIRNCITRATTSKFCLLYISNDLGSCAVTIIMEAKTITLPTSNTLAKIQ